MKAATPLLGRGWPGGGRGPVAPAPRAAAGREEWGFGAMEGWKSAAKCKLQLSCRIWCCRAPGGRLQAWMRPRHLPPAARTAAAAAAQLKPPGSCGAADELHTPPVSLARDEARTRAAPLPQGHQQHRGQDCEQRLPPPAPVLRMCRCLHGRDIGQLAVAGRGVPAGIGRRGKHGRRGAADRTLRAVRLLMERWPPVGGRVDDPC